MKNASEGSKPPVDSLYIRNLKIVIPIHYKAGSSDIPKAVDITLCKSKICVIFIISDLICHDLSMSKEYLANLEK